MIRESFLEVFDLQTKYSPRKNPDMDQRSLLIKKTIPAWLRTHLVELIVGSQIEDLQVEGQDQIGNKSKVPWIRIYSKSRSPRAPIGWYVVFLFDETGESVFLCLGHGSTNPDSYDTNAKSYGKARSDQEMQELVAWGRAKLPSHREIDRRLLPVIDLKGTKKNLGKAYEKTTLFGFQYKEADFPNDQRLLLDIETLLRLLKVLYVEEEVDPTLPGSVTLESDAANEAIFKAAGRADYQRKNRGPRLTGAESKVIENHAISEAINYIRELGWTEIEDVGAKRSYDLHCKRGAQEIYVEVKGTQSHGEVVVLTRNEVRLHKNEYPNNALVIVRKILLTKGESPTASGGELIFIHPWKIEDAELDPIGFDYRRK